MTFDLSIERYNVLNRVPPHTNLNIHASFLSCVIVFERFLNFADLRWPLTSAESNTFLLFNQFHPCTKYEVHLLPYSLLVMVFTSQGISQIHTNSHTCMESLCIDSFCLPEVIKNRTLIFNRQVALWHQSLSKVAGSDMIFEVCTRIFLKQEKGFLSYSVSYHNLIN